MRRPLERLERRCGYGGLVTIVAEEIIQKVPGWAENRDRMEREYQAPTTADAEWADAVVFGTPTRFGNVCAELKAYIDGLGASG